MTSTVTQEDVTLLLKETAAGNKDAESRLMAVVQTELHRRAAYYLSHERPDHTLQATALVNEVYLRLAGQFDRDWQSRAHFFGVAAHLMRFVLVDHARRHRASKHGGQLQKISLDEDFVPLAFVEEQYENLIAVDELLDRLSRLDPRAARVVELRFFGGLSVKEVAEITAVHEEIVKDDWTFARAWLSGELKSRN